MATTGSYLSVPSTPVTFATGAPQGSTCAVTHDPGAWSAYLAPSGGNTVSTGFVGNRTGANASPASFARNGTVCTTTYS